MIRETVKLRHLHIAPRKARLIANLIKGMTANEAEAQLMLASKRSAEPILKLLKSAVANAVNNRKVDQDALVVETVMVDQGPSFKRFLPRAMGRATPILKRTCHVTLVLKEAKKKKTARFNTAIVKKEKEAKKIAKAVNKPKYENKDSVEKEAPKSESKQGFTKKVFRRKSV
ncbi:MAG: 50S ribosomal protein L22 [Patescibacteria group bacterium]|nr:50S ribosomal protein L22 [Patescibacteria group bacterium]